MDHKGEDKITIVAQMKNLGIQLPLLSTTQIKAHNGVDAYLDMSSICVHNYTSISVC